MLPIEVRSSGRAVEKGGCRHVKGKYLTKRDCLDCIAEDVPIQRGVLFGGVSETLHY